MMSPHKLSIEVWRWFLDHNWRGILILLLPPLSLLIFMISLSSASPPITALYSSLPSFHPLRSFFNTTTIPPPPQPISTTIAPPPQPISTTIPPPPQPISTIPPPPQPISTIGAHNHTGLGLSRMAVCLVGGARRFELTGPSIVERILKVYPNADLFLHSPLDSNAFKLSALKTSPRIAAVKIFKPKSIPETKTQVRVLSAKGSPNGIQGLLQYFHLVEECLTMIKSHQGINNFTYDWIVRTRVDGYWSDPLGPENFVPGRYVVPPGSAYHGLNDRFGVGDYKTSTVALSRLSLIPQLDSAGFRQLNSESAFRAQLTTNNVPYVTNPVPFCVVSDRKYSFLPIGAHVPVAAMSSPGPLNGAKCRPCTVACNSTCLRKVMDGSKKLRDRRTEWAKTLHLCDASRGWENGWERIFDRTSGKELAAARKRVWGLNVKQCVDDFENMKGRASNWDAPEAVDICKLGLEQNRDV